jgi:hypothetical protein
VIVLTVVVDVADFTHTQSECVITRGTFAGHRAAAEPPSTLVLSTPTYMFCPTLISVIERRRGSAFATFTASVVPMPVKFRTPDVTDGT